MNKAKLQEEINAALKSRDEIKKNILKVILGEVQMQEVRTGKPATDEDIVRVAKKTVEGIKETLTLRESTPADVAELSILEGMLPKDATAEEIMGLLMKSSEAIKAAKSDGQATGIAMKIIKEAGLSANGQLVKHAAAEIRKE